MDARNKNDGDGRSWNGAGKNVNDDKRSDNTDDDNGRCVKEGSRSEVSGSGTDNNGRDNDENGRDNDEGQSGAGTQTLVKPKPDLKEPSFYKVVLLNDDYTPMDFVVHVLQKFFGKNMEDANRIMLQVHQLGSGVAGIYSHEIAETKVYLVNDYARRNKHPLKCTMEKTS